MDHSACAERLFTLTTRLGAIATGKRLAKALFSKRGHFNKRDSTYATHRQPLDFSTNFRNQPLVALPASVVDVFGYGLCLAQAGGRLENSKVLRGFGDASVVEIIESGAGGTYRAVYTVRFEAAVFVLHVFQKKSK